MNQSPITILNSSKENKIAILWGAGLGDLLVLRSLVQAIQTQSNSQIFLLTTATHLPHILNDICSRISLIQLSTHPVRLLEIIQKWRGKFDLVYLGPYPRWKTLLLGMMLGYSQVWRKRHKNKSAFILEQVNYDIKLMGLIKNQTDKFPYGTLPWKKQPLLKTKNENDLKPYLVLHLTSKEKWETTRWPLDHWTKLIKKILSNTEKTLYLIGIDSEKTMLDKLHLSFSDEDKKRIRLCISWPLQKVYSLVDSSSGVICHNSGILHIATVSEKQTLCITGSSAAYWRPPYPWVRNITSGECNRACNQYRCPIPFFDAKCIKKLTVNDVWSAVQEHLLS